MPFVHERAADLIQAAEFLQLSKEMVLEILQDESMDATEEEFCVATNHWIQAHSETLKKEDILQLLAQAQNIKCKEKVVSMTLSNTLLSSSLPRSRRNNKASNIDSVSYLIAHSFDSEEFTIRCDISNIHQKTILSFKAFNYDWELKLQGKTQENTKEPFFSLKNNTWGCPHILFQLSSVQTDGNERCFFKEQLSSSVHGLILEGTNQDILKQAPDFFSPNAGYFQGSAISLKANIKLINS